MCNNIRQSLVPVVFRPLRRCQALVSGFGLRGFEVSSVCVCVCVFVLNGLPFIRFRANSLT